MNDTRTSKFISLVLRHHSEKIKITLEKTTVKVENHTCAVFTNPKTSFLTGSSLMPVHQPFPAIG